MLKFRNAAVAAAAAVSLTLAGTTVASAGDQHTEETTTQSSVDSLPTSSSQIGKDQGAWDYDEDGNPIIKSENQVSGGDLFGGTTGDNPDWAENWKRIATVSVIGSLIGIIVAGVNWMKFQGILPY